MPGVDGDHARRSCKAIVSMLQGSNSLSCSGSEITWAYDRASSVLPGRCGLSLDTVGVRAALKVTAFVVDARGLLWAGLVMNDVLSKQQSD